MLVSVTLVAVIIILSLIFLILFALNAWYWSKIYYGKEIPTDFGYTKGEAWGLFVANLVFVFMTLGLLIYGIYLATQLGSVTTTTTVPVVTERRTETHSNIRPITGSTPVLGSNPVRLGSFESQPLYTL
jgi:hypothetical protein